MKVFLIIFNALLLYLSTFLLAPQELFAQLHSEQDQKYLQGMMDWGEKITTDYTNDVASCNDKSCFEKIEKKYRLLINNKEKECKIKYNCSMDTNVLFPRLLGSGIMVAREEIFLDLADHYKKTKNNDDAKRLYKIHISQYPDKCSDVVNMLKELQ